MMEMAWLKDGMGDEDVNGSNGNVGNGNKAKAILINYHFLWQCQHFLFHILSRATVKAVGIFIFPRTSVFEIRRWRQNWKGYGGEGGRASHGWLRCACPRVGASLARGTLPLPLSRQRWFLWESCSEENGEAVTLMGVFEEISQVWWRALSGGKRYLAR